MLALVTLLVVILVSLIVTRIASVALVATGLSKSMARFQARSAFTGVGFTTSEAENVVTHPVRRRIVAILMLFGSAGIASAIATLILTFGAAREDEDLLARVLVLVAGLIVIFLLASSSWVDRRVSSVIRRILARYTRLEVRDYVSLLDLEGDYAVTEMLVQADDWLADRTLKQLDLRREGVQVLGVRSQEGRYQGVPEGDTPVRAGDTLMLYGRRDLLADLDERKSGTSGELRHVDRVVEQRRLATEERSRDGEADAG